MQLTLFGDDIVEAPTAPISQVVTSTKNYKLVPPTNIIIDKAIQQIEKNVEQETKNNKKNPKVPKVKKENTVSIKSEETLEIIPELVKKKETKTRTIISLDLFAEVVTEPVKKEVIEDVPEVISTVLTQDSKKNKNELVQRETKEVFPGFIQLEILDVFAEPITKETQHSVLEVASQPTQAARAVEEQLPAQTPKQVKPKHVLKVPNVIEITVEPIQGIKKETISEVQPPIIEDVVSVLVPEAIESEDVEITTSFTSEQEDIPVKISRGRQSVGNFQADLLLINIPDDEVLFSKQYYPISEVATMFNVKVSLLRFWENEFAILKPRKNRKGDRLFRPDDIKSLKLIYFLLREKKYTIEGAKIFIKKGKKVKEKFAAIESLKKIKGMLLELKAGLSF
jgi:DNA-binding transcriptional MerR regulator